MRPSSRPRPALSCYSRRMSGLSLFRGSGLRRFCRSRYVPCVGVGGVPPDKTPLYPYRVDTCDYDFAVLWGVLEVIAFCRPLTLNLQRASHRLSPPLPLWERGPGGEGLPFLPKNRASASTNSTAPAMLELGCVLAGISCIRGRTQGRPIPQIDNCFANLPGGDVFQIDDIARDARNVGGRQVDLQTWRFVSGLQCCADAAVPHRRYVIVPIAPLVDQSHRDLSGQAVAGLAVERAGDIRRVVAHAIERDQCRASAGLAAVPDVIGARPAQIKEQDRLTRLRFELLQEGEKARQQRQVAGDICGCRAGSGSAVSPFGPPLFDEGAHALGFVFRAEGDEEIAPFVSQSFCQRHFIGLVDGFFGQADWRLASGARP